jgi:hypothetical protein
MAVRARVVHRDARVLAQELEEVDFGGGDLVALHHVAELHHADHPPATAHGHGDHRARLEARDLIEALLEARVARDVADHGRLIVHEHPARDALVRRQMHVLQVLGGAAEREPEAQALGGVVAQQDRPVLRCEQATDGGHDFLEHVVERERGRRDPSDFRQNVQVALEASQVRHGPRIVSTCGPAQCSK